MNYSKAGVIPDKFVENFSCPICGAIVDNDDFQVGIILPKQRLKRSCNFLSSLHAGTIIETHGALLSNCGSISRKYATDFQARNISMLEIKIIRKVSEDNIVSIAVIHSRRLKSSKNKTFGVFNFTFNFFHSLVFIE